MSIRVIVNAVIFSILLTAIPIEFANAQDRDSLKASLAPIFVKQCRSCHNWRKGDDYEVFDKDGFPFPGKIDSVLKRVQLPVDAEGHMPPEKVFAPDNVKTLAAWVDSEKKAAIQAGAGPVAGVGPSPAAPSCKLLASAPSDRRGITNGEATAIMERACSQCHGKNLQFTTGQKAAGAGALLAALLLLAMKLKERAKNRSLASTGGDRPALSGPPASQGDSCPSFWRRISRAITPTRLLVAAGGLSASFVAGAEGLKLPHTQFLNVDGSLDPAIFASQDETLGRILSQVSGVDGREFMPPRNIPKLLVGHYSEEDRKRLSDWFRQQLADDLPEDCEAFVGDSGAPVEGFPGAAKACDAAGMRVPTGAQMAQLAQTLGTRVPVGTCVWTSGFSKSEESPRQAWKDGALVDVSPTENCRALCVR